MCVCGSVRGWAEIRVGGSYFGLTIFSFAPDPTNVRECEDRDFGGGGGVTVILNRMDREGIIKKVTCYERP